jgi:hypothetical protein
MSKTLEALQAIWKFASDMVEKHGMEGDDTMTDAEHQAWQEAGALCNAATAKANVSLSEDDLAKFMLQRIENGDLALEDIPVRLARYGLMEPSAFVAEMRERMMVVTK